MSQQIVANPSELKDSNFCSFKKKSPIIHVVMVLYSGVYDMSEPFKIDVGHSKPKREKR